MAILNESKTEKVDKDYWRTPQNLIDDALFLLNIPSFSSDVCCLNESVSINESLGYIPEEEDALSVENWYLDSYIKRKDPTFEPKASLPMFCNPPFSRKWEFVDKVKEQVNLTKIPVLMVLPYTNCTKAWKKHISQSNAIIYLPNGRYNYKHPVKDAIVKNGCNFETALVLFVPYETGIKYVEYQRSDPIKGTPCKVLTK